MASESLTTWEAWETVHQPYELDFWIKEGIPSVAEPTFEGWWQRIFDFVTPRGNCLDVGCGARPPFGPGSTAIEPLATEFSELEPEWWEGVNAFAHPAEYYEPALKGGFDTVMCWNCLDHTIGWKQILANLAAYAKPDAVVAIASDIHGPMPGHPGFEREEFFSELGQHFQVLDARGDFQERDVALVLRCA